MKLPLRCEACGLFDDYEPQEVVVLGDFSFVACHRCSLHITLLTETVTFGEKLEREVEPPVEVLEEGAVVRIDNPDHVWHNQIALVCGRKPKFYRLDVNGKRVWVPQEWVKTNELPNLDERDG